MSGGMRLAVRGIGVWAPGLPDWTALRAHLDGVASAADAPARPAAGLLPPAERRRAPDTVRLAVEAAAQAVAMSGLDAANLPSVFTSSHGDAKIMDYMCATLAEAPAELSPTRFHNSVHNAASGYWTIATGCRRASNAVCADGTSFGAGLLEAATQAVTGNEPVLLAAFDAPGSGPLDEMIPSRVPFACALVLAPSPATDDPAALGLRLDAGNAAPSLPQDARLRELARANACGDGLALLEALARGQTALLRIPAGEGLVLCVQPGAAA